LWNSDDTRTQDTRTRSKLLTACHRRFSCITQQAHARLCARSCVTLQDAVMAVLILDSSMTGSSLMGWSNALHTHFPDDPDAEYDVLERQVRVCGAGLTPQHHTRPCT
jgi:DNA helicase MCM9